MAHESDVGAENGSNITGSLPGPPPLASFQEPLSQDISQFLSVATKTAKGIRVYASNNESLRRYIDDAYGRLVAILDREPELTLTIREDRLIYKRDVVHVNNDREEGLPFILYRNAFRRITILSGATRDELIGLLTAIVTDYSNFDYSGEDLVSSLWRLSLPHLRYLTIDAMTVESRAAKAHGEQEEVERIQADIEGIVARIYQTDASDDDLVAGVSITKEDLEAFKDVRAELTSDLDLLDVATARPIADLDAQQVAKMLLAIGQDTRDSLTIRMLDVLTIILFKEKTAAESKATIELMQQLFDSLLFAQRYRHAVHLVLRLRDRAEASEDLKERHIAGHLLKMFSSETRVLPVLNSFNDDYKVKSVIEMMEFLRALGPSIVPHLLTALDFLNAPAHRRLICDLVLEHGAPNARLLLTRMTGAKGFLARDLLFIGSKLPPDELAPLVHAGLKNDHPKVREAAVALLRPYARGPTDLLVAERLSDTDGDVRMAAVRVAAARKSVEARPAFEAALASETLPDRDPRELRLLMTAYSSLFGAEAVPALEKILTSSFFGRARMTEAQTAAAAALATITASVATEALERGMRTLNSKVREACRKALAKELDRDTSDLPSTADIQLRERHRAKGVAENAPAFAPSAPREPEKKPHPQFAKGPSTAGVRAPHGGREEMPRQMIDVVPNAAMLGGAPTDELTVVPVASMFSGPTAEATAAMLSGLAVEPFVAAPEPRAAAHLDSTVVPAAAMRAEPTVVPPAAIRVASPSAPTAERARMEHVPPSARIPAGPPPLPKGPPPIPREEPPQVVVDDLFLDGISSTMKQKRGDNDGE